MSMCKGHNKQQHSYDIYNIPGINFSRNIESCLIRYPDARCKYALQP